MQKKAEDKNIREDKTIEGLLRNIPERFRDSFTDDQLVGLKVALGERKWKKHPVDLRTNIQIWRWRFYVVFVMGRDRRRPTRAQRKMAQLVDVIFLTLLIVIAMAVGLVAMYLLKSAVGIDVFEGMSSGVFDWFIM